MKKITLLSILFFVSALSVLAQNTRQWGTYYGGTRTDYGFSVATDPSGNVYLAGYTNDNTSAVFTSGGFQNTFGGGTNDAFLVKFDASGSRLWATYYGGSGDDQGYSVSTDANGNVYLAGITTSTNNISSGGAFQTANAGGTYDAFLVKFDSGGNRVWGTYYGDAGDDEARSVFADASGNVFLAGYTDGNVNIDTSAGFQTTYGGGTFDAFISKFDAGGNQLWATYYGDAGDDEGRGVVLDASGNIYFTGSTTSNGNMATFGAYQTSYGGGTSDGFLTKITSGGNLLWATYYGGGGTDEGRSIAIHSNNLYISGRTGSNSGIASVGAYQTVYAGGTYDAYLVRFDTSGTRNWGTYYGGTGYDVGYMVATDQEGNIYLGGRTASAAAISSNGFQNTYGGAPGQYDAYFVKFDTSGSRYAATYTGGTGTEYGYGLAVHAGKIYLAGYTSSLTGIASSTGYDNTYGAGTGTADAFLVKYDSYIPVSTSQTNLLCNGVCNGKATATPRGATLLPYTYSWNPGGQTTQVATGLCAGSYTVVATDANGNFGTASVTITQPTALTTSVNTTQATCGNSDGNAGVIVSGGTAPYAYSWTTSPVQTTQIASGVPAGTYTVTVSDANGCTKSAVATVTNSNGPTVIITSQTNASCNGGSDGTATASASGTTPPYTYTWSTSPVQSTATATGLSAGTFTVTAIDASGCKGTTTVTITQPSALTTNVSTTNATCTNSDGSAGVLVGGGTAPYSYSWSTSPVQTTFNATGIPAGTYTVLVTDSKGCTTSATATVNTSGPSASISSQTNVSCFGGNDGAVTASVTGGIPAYTYLWSPSGGTTSAATGLTAGNYSVLVTDGTGCTSSATATITEPTVLSITVSATATTCGNNNGTTTVTAAGGSGSYTYNWSTTPAQTTSTATGLTGGTYTISVSDSKGCTAAGTATVTNSSAPNVIISSQTNVSCNGASTGSASASVGGGQSPFNYSWSTSPVQTTFTATGLSAGNYSVTVTDANACTGSQTLTITEPTALTVSVSTTSTTCGSSTGTATASASGGTGSYTYGWSTTPIQLTPTATGLPAGTYTVVVLDANSCSATLIATVTNSNGPSVTVSLQTNVTCNGGSNGTASTTVTGGTSPYTYNWSNGQSTSTATALASGSYTVVVTDAGGCTSVATATITEPAAITSTITSTNENCGQGNGTATVNASGGTGSYTYGWSTSPIQFSQTATGLSAGTYTVVVSDANSCTHTATVAITNTSGPTASVSSITNVSCNGACDGSATASASGGTPSYTYNWFPSGQITQTINNLCAGTYTVLVIDANGCSSTATISVSEPTVITASVSTTNSSCSSSTGTASVVASGGNGSYSYSWSTSPVQTTTTATGLAAGSYTVVITDANGCTAASFANVINSNGPIATVSSQTNVSCNGGSDGSATVSVTGGQTPYTYSWSDGSTTSQISGVPAQTYTVVVTDANGCSSVTTATITEPTALTVSVTTANGNCSSSVGTATAAVAGGTGSYTYLWSDGQSVSTATGLAAGTYTLIVSDANGCTQTATATIVIANAPVASIFSQTNVSCNGGNDGTATATATSGTPPYSYLWNPSAASTATATGLSAGTYTVTVTDANSCTSSATVTLTQPNGMSTTMSSTSAACGSNNGSASVSVSGGSSPYTYSWSTSPVQNTATATGLSAGTYSVTITDASGCTKTSAVTIINYNGPIVSITAQTNASCFGASDGSASATATGATPPYNYSWNSSPVQNTQTAIGLSAGMYTVTVTDAGGCNGIAVVAITEPTAVTATATAGAASCSSCCDGIASVSASGGTSPYIYSWSTTPAQTTVTATGLCASAVYTVCATDASGCSSCTTVAIPWGTGVSSLQSVESISIYPNPVNDYIFVEGTVSSSEKLEVNVLNLFGQILIKKYIDAGGKFSEKIDVSGMPAGIYLIEINSKELTKKLKFVKQ